MNLKQITEAVRINFDSTSKLIPHIQGQPGLGKSQSIKNLAKQIAEEQELEFYEGPENFDPEKFGLIELRLNQLEVSDLTGIPVPNKDIYGNTTVTYAPTPFIPSAGQGILFIDELRHADKIMLSLASQLLLDRRVGPHSLGEGWKQVAAANRLTDRAAANKYPTHVADRLQMFDAEFDIEGFEEHLHSINAPDVAIAYAKYQPQDLQSFDPAKEMNCTPRSFVESLPFLDSPEHLRFHLIKGCIGEGFAAKFLGFTKIWKELPRPEDIAENPETAKVPEKADAQFGVVSMLGFNVTPETFENMMQYVKRLPDQEYQTLFVKTALRKNPKLANEDAFNKFLNENAAVLV